MKIVNNNKTLIWGAAIPLLMILLSVASINFLYSISLLFIMVVIFYMLALVIFWQNKIAINVNSGLSMASSVKINSNIED